VVSVELEVAFHDCDLGGIAWHGNYYRWFEIGRTALLRSLDLDVPWLVQRGVRVVVGESRCRHHAPLRYGERFVVAAWIEAIGPGVDVRYRITKGAPDAVVKVAEGRTSLVAVAPHEDRIVDVPPDVLERLARGMP
jgi:acyl-CoA thioester hydrolase